MSRALVLALAGCGRIGFDSLSATSDDELVVMPATATINIGSKVELTVDGGEPPYAFTLAGEGTMVDNVFVAPSRAGASTIAVGDAAGRAGSTTIEYRGAMLFVVGGIVGGNETNTVLASSDGTTWVGMGELPAPRANGALVVYDDRLIYMGGLDQNGIPSDEVFASIDGATWTLIGQLPTPLTGFTGTVHSGELWIVGGFTGGQNRGEALHSSDGSAWIGAPAALSEPRHEHDVVSRGGRLFVIGGHGDNAFLDDVQSTIDGSSWIAEGTLSFAADFPAVGELGDRVFRVCGSGCNDTETSLDLQTWSPGAALPVAGRDSPALVGFGGRLLVIGGGQQVFATTDGLAWGEIGMLPELRTLTAAVQFTPP